MQLFVTIIIVSVIVSSFDASLWLRENIWVVILCMFLSLTLMIAIACCPSLGRRFPCNFILLGVITLCQSILLTVICWFYRTEDILIAMGITLGIFVVLTIFAIQTKIDFTVCTGFLLIAFLLLMVIGIVAIFFKDRLLHIIYSSLCVLVLSMAIVIDTQLMLIGKHSQSFGPKDYVVAALTLYVDIINLFIHVLRLLGLLGSG